MKRTKNKILILLVTILGIFCLNIGTVNAALQANPNTQYTKTDTPGNWMVNFRNMEKTGQAMGLSETLNEKLTSTSSNGIDVHMCKTTEYGAVAILSASGYGNPSNDKAITTTTGNSTGVILNTDNWENTAGGLSGSIFGGVDKRYYDEYTDSNGSAKVGDAFACAGWHMALPPYWVTSADPFFGRGWLGIFSYSRGYSEYLSRDDGFCRGVAVCGEGL